MCDHGCDCHDDPFMNKIYNLLESISPECSDIAQAQLFLTKEQQIGIKFILKNKKDFTHIFDHTFDEEITKNQIIDKYNKV